MQYLYEEQHYIDRYDLFTIMECLRAADSCLKTFQNVIKINSKKYDKQKNAYETVLELELYFIKGEEYKRKRVAITEWMEKDKQEQNFYDNTEAPLNISCNTCGDELYSDFKILENDTDKPMRVLFFFPCKTCKKKMAIYNNGQERIYELPRCPKCNNTIEEKHKVKGKGKVIAWTKNCPSCGFNETEVDDFEKSHAKFEEDQKKDKELLNKYRSEFCLSDVEGQKYVSYTTQLKTLMESIKESDQKQADPAYQKAKKLKKLSVVELEKLLAKTLEKEKYIKLSFGNPEMGQFVIIPFNVQESNSNRKEYDTTATLKKLLKTTLENTNWRLMTEGVSYRLGYVHGRLKGYEREEDLANLMRVKTIKDNPVMVDGRGPIF